MAGDLILVFLAGCIFFPTLYLIIARITRKIYRNTWNEGDISVVADQAVSFVQSTLATISGLYIALSCDDVINDVCWLTNVYTCFGVVYFYYDTVAMYNMYWHTHENMQKKTRVQAILHFLKVRRLMVVHHVILPMFYFPVIMYFRNGKGDFFVGCFYASEFAVPFITVRKVLKHFKMEDTCLYLFFGIGMIVTFFTGRVLLFPFMFWRYGLQYNTSLWEVPRIIPRVCTLSCLFLASLMIYWTTLMVHGAFVHFIKKSKSDKNKA